MLAAIILCLVTQAGNATLLCSDGTRIRIAGLQSDISDTRRARRIIEGLTVGKQLSCLPAGDEPPFLVAKCALPDRRDLACTLIGMGAATRSDASWRRYGLGPCA